ncbi:unnamed protein product [Clonostachys chloroleuca]|uniref:SMODS and SLOG-associating 2TM effector domain-containing protein n=1 Tax=Clonostachys chloroleuca TaxID=1926264 RepID=A0AA35M140_9HYPO|nr:unnamed protein product [Clonostachys chloroleuca]
MSQAGKKTAEVVISPLPMPAESSNQSSQLTHTSNPKDEVPRPSSVASDDSEIEHHRFLSPSKWKILAQSVGGLKDIERTVPTHPSSSWWPARGMPPGLYRDVVTKRTRYYYTYWATSVLQWLLMILQLLLGASLTALGSVAVRDGTPITLLGATNTVIAGLLALVHNSGLPERHKRSMYEYEKVQDHIKELLDSRMAPEDLDLDQVIAECFDMYQEAKSNAMSARPLTYGPRYGLAARGVGRQDTLTLGRRGK